MLICVLCIYTVYSQVIKIHLLIIIMFFAHILAHFHASPHHKHAENRYRGRGTEYGQIFCVPKNSQPMRAEIKHELVQIGLAM